MQFLMNALHSVEIYGFSGKLGSGKNYIAEQLFIPLLDPKPTLVLALADQIKINCMIKDRVSFERLYVKKDHSSRRLLQQRGTEEGRSKLGSQVWIEYLEAWMRVHQSRGIQRFIVSDLRFPNEVEWLKSLGGIAIRVEAPTRNHDQLLSETGHLVDRSVELSSMNEDSNDVSEHSSETSLDNYPYFDYLIYNDYLDNFSIKSQITQIIQQIKVNSMEDN